MFQDSTGSRILVFRHPSAGIQLIKGTIEPGECASDAALRELCGFVDKLIAEDEPVLNTMRFRKGVLVASDRHLARYFKYVSEFPRGQPPSE